MDKHIKPDFTGQTIYIGIDVHKSSWSVSILSEEISHKAFTQPPEVSKLVNYLQRNFPGATFQAVYEAGFSGFWLYEQLQSHGINCMVVNPADVPTNNKEKRRKRDAVDCKKLAKRLRSKELKSVYVPKRPQMEDRGLLRTRKAMVCKQTRCQNQIIAILYFYGITIPEKKRWSGRFVKELENIPMQTDSGDLLLQTYLDELIYLRRTIASLNRAILNLSKTEKYMKDMYLLKTIPGVSTITAMTFLTELIDINRFKSFDRLCSFVGLVPDTSGSGDKEGVLGITTRQNKLLRSMLIQSAWIASRKDPALMLAFNKLCQRMKKTKAIVRIARKLLSRIRYVLKEQQAYELAVAA